eukprot:PhM_4_TR1633/c0_g1_i1/m.57658/K19751/DNAAF2, KTU, PF13; dynein assembly factor 2, axonemal
MDNISSIDMHRKDDKFQATPEEINMIKSKMNDPEFRRLWEEYAESLTDPKYRAEEEEYLKQVEAEAKAGGDHSFDFVIPEGRFVVKLGAKEGKKRVYINVCASEKIEEASEDASGGRVAQWRVPVSVGPSHEEEHEGHVVVVFDAVYHPRTLFLADRSQGFTSMLVDIAVENINHGYKKSYGNQHQRMGSAITSIGRPKPQTIRGKPKSTPPTTTTSPSPSSAPPKSATAAAPATAQKAKPAAPPKPSYKVLHRSGVDLLDAWNFKHSDKRIGVPTHLIVRVELPGVVTVSEIDAEVLEKSVVLTCTSGKYSDVDIPMPFTVDPDDVKAKFEKGKQVLTITVRVKEQKEDVAVKESLQRQRKEFESDAREQQAREKADVDAVVAEQQLQEAEARERELQAEKERRELERKVIEERERRLREDEERRRELEERQSQWRQEEEKRVQALRAEEDERRRKHEEERQAAADREEAAAREKEQRKAQRELQRKLELAKEAEKNEELLRAKQREMPLKNQLITLLD